MESNPVRIEELLAHAGWVRKLAVRLVRDAASADDAARIVADAAKTRPANAWVLGRGWDQNKWAGQQFPSAATLDAISHPVLLERVDGHAIWINTRSLGSCRSTSLTRGANLA